ncbi:retained [Carabus blaptoides fortunei]
MDPHDRDSDIGEDSPMSHVEEDLSEGRSDGDVDHDEAGDSCDEALRAVGAGGPRLHSNHHVLHPEHPADVLAKLKMQVRDIKDEFEVPRSLHGGGGGLVGGSPNMTMSSGVTSAGGGFTLPVTFPFPHPFMPPMAPQQAPPSSGSSHSSEGSASSQQTWSFEEQFKQVRQLYEINDDPKRKEFLDDLFTFMQKRGTPINRLPIMAKSVLDLYELYNLVIARGGLVDVINKKLWQEIIKGLHLPSSITSAAFTLRTQYMKYLYPYECEKRRLSTPAELQAAIDGNRREGRRSSYGTYSEMVQRSPVPSSQMSPLSLVTQQQTLAARGALGAGLGLHNGAHHPTHPQPLGQPPVGGPIPGLAPSEFEARMVEYVKLLNKELRSSAATPPRQGSSSPPNATSPLNPLEMSRLTLWNLYNNNPTPPCPEPQKEALNLSEATNSVSNSIKREPERDPPPPAKRLQHDEDRGSPVSSPSTHIKINSRGDARTGDNSLVVSMELNGVTYQGVLFAQSPPAARTKDNFHSSANNPEIILKNSV